MDVTNEQIKLDILVKDGRKLCVGFNGWKSSLLKYDVGFRENPSNCNKALTNWFACNQFAIWEPSI
jgi:hypothetical protein